MQTERGLLHERLQQLSPDEDFTKIDKKLDNQLKETQEPEEVTPEPEEKTPEPEVVPQEPVSDQ